MLVRRARATAYKLVSDKLSLYACNVVRSVKVNCELCYEQYVVMNI